MIKSNDVPGDVPNDVVTGERPSTDVLDILRQAVNTARDHQVKDVSQLRKMLIEKHPKQECDVDAALDLWRGYVKSKGPAALPRMR